MKTSNSQEFDDFQKTANPLWMNECKPFVDSLLQLLSSIVSHCLMNIQNGMQLDLLFILHAVNSFACLLKVLDDSTCLQASTVSKVLMTFLQGIFMTSQDSVIIENQSIKTVFHKLLRLYDFSELTFIHRTIDTISLPVLIEGICLFITTINPWILQEKKDLIYGESIKTN